MAAARMGTANRRGDRADRRQRRGASGGGWDLLTGVEVADDGVGAEPRLPPRPAAGGAAGAGEPEELPRPGRVQLAAAVGEHGDHAGLPWSEEELNAHGWNQ
jgi:hypothetical protein